MIIRECPWNQWQTCILFKVLLFKGDLTKTGSNTQCLATTTVKLYSAPKVTHQQKEVWWWNNSENRKKPPQFPSTTHGFRGLYKYSPGCVRHGWGWVLDSRKTSGEVWMVAKRHLSFTNSYVASVKSGLCRVGLSEFTSAAHASPVFYYYWLPQLYMSGP